MSSPASGIRDRAVTRAGGALDAPMAGVTSRASWLSLEATSDPSRGTQALHVFPANARQQVHARRYDRGGQVWQIQEQL